MVRNARATLAQAYNKDVGMVNCQPSILAQKLRMHDIACPHQDLYVANGQR